MRTREMLLLTCAMFGTLAIAGTPRALHGQTCWRCNNSYPYGSRCRQDIVGSAGCWEDLQGCHTSGACQPSLRVATVDTAASAILRRFAMTRATLRRARNGTLFLKFDVGKVIVAHTDARGVPTI